MVINGRKVAGQPRRSLDGLSFAPGAPKASPAPLPRHNQATTPTQAAPVKPITRRVPKKAHALHQKQSTAVKRRKPAQNVVFVKTHKKPTANHKDHKLPQSAALTEARLQRAAYHRQSHHVTRFGVLSDHSFKQYRQHPSQKAKHAAVNVVEYVIPQAGPPAKPRTINKQIAEYHLNQQSSQLPKPTAKPSQRLGGIFSSRRIVSLSAAALSFMVLLGYAAYLNAPNLAFRVAASRAGIEATMPGYQPSGFALNGPIEYTDGEVTINYKANADQRKFSLIQRESDWDSRSLLENYVSRESARYEVIEEDGLTIYNYNGSEAAWVNRGMLFVIDGESLLDKDQLTRLATSL